ncbi:unnamed protein product, partial [Hapterophycus canaliculatus]
VAVAFPATVSADIWHRRLGHLNPRSMDILRKTEGSAVGFTDVLSGCNMCAL